MKCRAVPAPWMGTTVLKASETPDSCKAQPHTLGTEWEKSVSSSRNSELRSLFLKESQTLGGIELLSCWPAPPYNPVSIGDLEVSCWDPLLGWRCKVEDGRKPMSALVAPLATMFCCCCLVGFVLRWVLTTHPRKSQSK